MKTNLLSNNFTAGELCEWMAGRTDTDSYAKGCKSLQNCLVRPFGGALKRPGLEYIAETKNTDTTRLIPFTFSIDETYIIEVGAGYFRFYKDGEVIETAPNTPYEVTNTYTESDINEIRFAQSNDVLFMVVGALEPKKLSRMADDDWTWTNLGYSDGPFLLENSSATTITPSGTTGAITLTASTAIFEAGHVGSFWSINQKKLVDDILIQGVVQITGYVSPTVVNAVVTKDLFSANATTIWSEGAWSNVRGFPEAVTFFDSRLWLANTTTETQKVWGSEVFVYNNFDKEESIEVELPSNKLNSINSLSPGRDLIALTLGGVFVISSGASSTAITSENVTAYQSGEHGSLNVQAYKIGDHLYYPQRSGEKLMEFKYSWENEGYVTSELSRVSEDVLSSGIKDMSLQETEDNILYMVLNDGRIAALTRVVDQEVSALSPLETEGNFISVASIYNSGQFWDDTYVIVQREIEGATKQYIEKFSKPRKTELTTGIFCDSAVLYSDMGGVTVLTGLEHLEGVEVQILRDGAVDPSQTVLNGEITLLKAGNDIVVGIGYTAEIEPMPFNITSAKFGSSQGLLKRPIYANLKLIDTMGIKIEGIDDEEEAVFLRDYTIVMGSPNPLKSGDFRVSIPKGAEIESTVKIIQQNPLPMNVLSITTRTNIQET